MISEYIIKARLAPTVLAAPPLLIFFNGVINIQANQWLETETMIMFFGKGTATTAIVFLMMQVNRLIGLEIFQRFIFKDENDFPTTRWLVATNSEMSLQQRESIDSKAHRDFGVGLLPRSLGDSTDVRRHNADLVGRIRLFVGSPPKLLQYNIEYGFFRNLIGATLTVLIASLANIYLYIKNLLPEWAFHLSIIYLIIVAALLCLTPFIIKRLGIQYARVLFQTYLETHVSAMTKKDSR